ncbi:Uncharacterised protein [uncultured Clostridium sp.]|nr:Uncharacterised protein [uncultured Clostridium sp.]
MIYIVTGLPGAGKTTYVKSRMKANDIVYDLDYISKAIVLGREKTRNSIYITNKLLRTFVELSSDLEADVYIIRVAPTKEEIELFNSYSSRYLDVCRDYSYCYEVRKDLITLEEFNKIHKRYKDYESNRSIRIEKVLINKERW